MKRIICTALVLLLLAAIGKVPAAAEGEGMSDTNWHFGFGRRQIRFDEDKVVALYISGYKNGVKISGVLDYCEARAVWLDAGGDGILFIGIDCVALDSGTIEEIRDELTDIPGCMCVNVYSTHTHAGPDTLGLWGRIGFNGKNAEYMNALKAAAAEAAREAADSTKLAEMYYGKVRTQDMYRDSRMPIVYDENLYQLRLQTYDGSAGLRLLFYGAHAESLRGDNTLLSRDYPGRLCDNMREATGDNAMFFPGAIGGLIMTRLFVNDMPDEAVKNMRITGDRLTEYTLSISNEDERQLEPGIRWARQCFDVPLDNPVFMTYKLLGILNSKAVPGKSATGFCVQSELNLIMLDDIALLLIPGEIFPELISGEAYGNANPSDVNPRPLKDIAREYGINELLIIGLANDELGYIIPPSDFLLNEKLPYVSRVTDANGEDHYEETNSVGPACAGCIAEALGKVLKQLFPEEIQAHQ